MKEQVEKLKADLAAKSKSEEDMRKMIYVTLAIVGAILVIVIIVLLIRCIIK